jgi:hypothetical protein
MVGIPQETADNNTFKPNAMPYEKAGLNNRAESHLSGVCIF